jgi:GWxTD domain-containing protein
MALGLVVWMALRLFRIRSPQDQSLVWTGVLLTAVTLPGLMKAIEMIFAGPQTKLNWLPAAPTLFLRPLPVVSTPTTELGTDWMAILTAIYFLVAGPLMLRIFVGLLRGLRAVRMATRIEEHWTRGWDVRASGHVTVPVTFASTILIPADWPEWSAFKRDAVLAHEQSHIRRCDFSVHLLATIHRAVFWFSPLAWWIQRRLLEVAEVASDEAAIEKLQDRLSYAATLIDVARRGAGANPIGLAMATGQTVEHRIVRLLEASAAPKKSSGYVRVALLAALVPLAGMSAGAWLVRAETTSGPLSLVPTQPLVRLEEPKSALEPLAAPQRVPRAQQAPQPAAQVSESPQFLSNWIEQEVPYIVHAEEVEAFRNLKKDEEREAFIASFWLLRDPTPGTPNNEYKDEYYRRIALANRLYTVPTGMAGWLTDRGQILVVYGQADQVETHPKGADGGATTLPFEKWRYRRIDGIGENVVLEFVDVDDNGNYRLTSARDKDGVWHVPGQPPQK